MMRDPSGHGPRCICTLCIVHHAKRSPSPTNLETLAVDASLLASLADHVEIPIHLARRALKRLADASPGEMKFFARLFNLHPETRDLLLASMAKQVPMVPVRAGKGRTFRLLSVDGEESHLSANEFFEANEDMVGTSDEDAIRALRVGEVFRGGGGAAPEWSIKRVD